MEAERSIVLQKKMILFLSLIIIAVFTIIYGREEKTIQNKYVAEVNKLDLVTVNASEDENEIIRKNVKYLAKKVIATNDVLNLPQVNEKKIEVFAGDVINIVDENLKKEENIDVAVNESTNNMEIITEKVETNEFSQNTTIEETKEEVIKTEVEEVVKVEEKIEEVKQVETSEITQKVVEQVENTKPKTVRYRDLAENNPPTEYKSVVEASATAYCLCKKCCGKSPDHPYYGYTHSGIKIEQGTGIKVIAVDPKVIPLKSKVYVEGLNGAWDYGHAIAADTGSAIKELKIDLYMDTHEEALQWGRRKVKVYVLGE